MKPPTLHSRLVGISAELAGNREQMRKVEDALVGLGNHVGELTNRIGRLELAMARLLALLEKLSRRRNTTEGSGAMIGQESSDE